MSIKTNKPSNVIDREYGRRMYVSKKSYADQIRIPTDKAAFNEVLRKQSEFKKPYLSDTYEEMEYFADPAPGYAFAPIDMDTPWMGTPVPDFGDMYDPWHLTFLCNAGSDACYCEGSEKCFNLSCTHEIVGIDVKESGWAIRISKSQVCITAPEGRTGSVEIDVHMRALRPWTSPHGTSKFVYGTHYNISLSGCDENKCCDASTTISWDDPNSDDTIARSGSATVTIIGTATPFTWSVSGTGFTLAYSTTVGLSNILYADAAACGSATITVTGCDGVSVIGYVRCTTGGWVYKSATCGLSGTPAESIVCPSGNLDLSKILGNKKQLQTVNCFSSLTSGCVEDPVTYPCPAAGVAEWCATTRCNTWGYQSQGACLMIGGNPPWCVVYCGDPAGCGRYCWATVSLDYYEWECI